MRSGISARPQSPLPRWGAIRVLRCQVALPNPWRLPLLVPQTRRASRLQVFDDPRVLRQLRKNKLESPTPSRYVPPRDERARYSPQGCCPEEARMAGRQEHRLEDERPYAVEG